MALISCVECGGQVSDKATVCPHCGAPVAVNEIASHKDEPKAAGGFKWWLWGPLALIALFFAFPYLAHSPEKRAAISARADCERVFPAERGRGCEKVYSDTLLGKLKN